MSASPFQPSSAAPDGSRGTPWPGIFSGLQDKGFYLVPVGYMFKDMKLEAGKEYFCRGYHGRLCSTPEHPYVEKDS